MNGVTRLAVFDCDGTLVDSQRIIVAAMSAAFAAEGLAVPDPWAIRHAIGLPLLEAILRLAPGHSSVDRLAQRYRGAYGERAGLLDFHEPLFPGAGAALDAIEQAGWSLGVATGKGRRGLVHLLNRHSLTARFVTLQTADDCPAKPCPDMLVRAMAEAGAERATTVMIGDTAYDMEMAKNAGVAAIGVAWGYHTAADLVAAGAECVAQDFDDLLGLIESVA